MIARKKIYRAYKPTGSYEKISFRTVDTKKANGPKSFAYFILKELAEWTGLEPATPGVTGRYSNQLNYHSSIRNIFCSWEVLAEWTGLEPATLGVTGRYSNQLNYHSVRDFVKTEISLLRRRILQKFFKFAKFFENYFSIFLVGAESLELPTYAV